MSRAIVIDLLFVLVFLTGLYYVSSMPYEQQDLRGTIQRVVDPEMVQNKLGHLSFYYGSKEISIASVGVAGFIEFFIRKFTHFACFALGTFLLYRLLSHVISWKLAIPWSGFAGLWLAVLDEWHQSFTPNRTAMIADIILDGSGVMFTIILLLLFSWWKKRRKGGKKTYMTW